MEDMITNRISVEGMTLFAEKIDETNKTHKIEEGLQTASTI